MMGDTSTILNCNLQRYLKKSVFIKHFVIFLSIYTFTFLLNWYALESLVVDGYIDRGQNNEKNNNVQNNNAENNNDDSKNIRKFKQRSLLNYLIYTIFIYMGGGLKLAPPPPMVWSYFCCNNHIFAVFFICFLALCT